MTPIVLPGHITAANRSSGGVGSGVVAVATTATAIIARPSTKGKAFCVTEIEPVKPSPYIAHGAVLLFPPHTDLTRLLYAGKLYINGWKKSVTLRSSYATPLLVGLCS